MVSKILKNVKNLAVVSVLFSSFMFVGCGESESDLKNLALEKCKKNAKSVLDNEYFPYEKFVDAEIISFEKAENKKGEYYKAECKINYILSRDYGNSKKGENYFQKKSIHVEKAFDSTSGKDKWIAN